MKFRNKWKTRLSVLLMVVMMLNMTFVASAEWKNDGDRWQFIKEDGTLVQGKVKQIHGNWYSFDEDGYMEAGKWIDQLGGVNRFYAVPNGELASEKWLLIDGDWYYFTKISEVNGEIEGGKIEPGLHEINKEYYYFDDESKMVNNSFIDIDYNGKARTFYAGDDGSIVKRGWNLLNAEVRNNIKLCDHPVDEKCNCSWYYFKDEEDGSPKGMVKDGIQTIQKKTYAFDGEKMISQNWYPDEDGNWYYFKNNGEKATSKWLPINGYWYNFNSNGKVTSYAVIPEGDGKLFEDAVETATESNAPYPVIDSITFAENDKNVNVEVGKDVVLKFNVNLASKSNADSNDLTNNHDIWVNGSKQGKAKLNVNKNTFEVTYTAGMTETTETVCVWADDVASEVVTVNTKLTKLADSSEDITSGAEVKDALDNILSKVEEDPTGVVESLKAVYDPENETVKEEVHSQFLEKDKQDQLIKLEENYVNVNNITNMKPEAVEDAGEVTVTGAALNAEPGDFVQLKVDAPKDENVTVEGFNVKAAFDIELSIMSADGTKKDASVLSIPVVITMKLPEGFTNSDKLFNRHNGEDIPVQFKVVDKNIQFVTDRFSTYVFAQVPEEPSNPNRPSSGGSGGGGGSSSSGGSSRGSNYSQMGTWKQDATGWWISLNDGTYPVNTWKYIDCNGVYKWYRFNEAGYMVSGWFTDVDGHIYYLNPVSDGFMGSMLTGWQLIDGVWYYFNTVSDGTQGALFVNTTTPDGYVVNEKGQWIQ